ncbi:M56 family metallopeptidase [Tenacibaculum geojense]|uniref:M56 family metallopeptidase n=1 Tax=Tenacibaculum geojense TaxID=915352 RepID=A0ABW3JUS9_9FLAO
MLQYIIQVILFQILFLAVYDLFLSKETFFNKNRVYLLVTVLLSFLLPLLKIETIQKSVSKEYTILLPEVVLFPQKVIEEQSWYQSIHYLEVLFWCGLLFFSILFLVKLYKIIKLISTHITIKERDYTLVLLPKNSKAFSFFNFIFLGEEIHPDRKQEIIQHELIHSKQKHSLDLLFFEFLKIIMWFNPMIWVFQKRISLVHEYITDDMVSKSVSTKDYIRNLLSEVFQVAHISFINQFYKPSLIKKRIQMMTKRKSKQIKQLKYLVLVPVLASMLFYSACTKENYIEQEKQSTVLYSDVKGMEKRISETKTSYMDSYLGFESPKTKELTLRDLSEVELSEYNELMLKMKEKDQDISLRIFEGFENNRKIVFLDMQERFKKFKNKSKSERNNDEVPFSKLDKSPSFPGAQAGKDIFNKNMTQFVKDNFDTSMINNLGLPSGIKRVYVQFKIDENGQIININARAPHIKIKEAVIEMIKKVPQLNPGEFEGNKVKVTYTLPITFKVD